jgi:hypothetical protein
MRHESVNRLDRLERLFGDCDDGLGPPVLVRVKGGTFTSLTGHIAGRQVNPHVAEDPHAFAERLLVLCAELGEDFVVVTGLPPADAAAE